MLKPSSRFLRVELYATCCECENLQAKCNKDWSFAAQIHEVEKL